MHNMKKLIISLLAGCFALGFAYGTHADTVCTHVDYNGSYDAVAFGADSPRFAAVSFSVPTDCTLTAASIGIFQVGTPDGIPFLSVFDNDSGNPGTLLEQGDDITPPGAYATDPHATSTFSGTLVLAADTTYWLVASTTLPNSNGDTYVADLTDSDMRGYKTKPFDSDVWDLGCSDTCTLSFEINGSDTPTPDSYGGDQATSSVDQVENNLYHGFIVFFMTFVFIIWFFRKNR